MWFLSACITAAPEGYDPVEETPDEVDTSVELEEDTGQPEVEDDPPDEDPPDDDPPDDDPPETHWVDEVGLYLNIGDSLAAGYDAGGEYGYAWLLDENRGFSSYTGHDLQTRSGAQVKHIADSGATSEEILDNLRDASLPSVEGEVVVTISAGGNDFNDEITTMVFAAYTEVAAAQVRANLAAMIDEVRGSYPSARIYVLNIQDPTGGTGTVPEGMDEGFCKFVDQWGAYIGPTVVENLGIMNAAIAEEAAVQGVELVDYHAAFLDHGLNTSDGWMSDDCAHPTDERHHQIRRLIWAGWTGDWY